MTTSINPTADGIVDLDDPSIHVPKGIQPLVDVWMRDTRVTLGHDGAYYLTGTTRAPDTGEINAGRFSDGIRLWRSEDLKNWEDLGLVWSIEAEGGALADLPVYENGTGSTYSPEAFRREVLPRLAQPEGDQSIQVRRGVWAPELNWLPRRGEYLLSFCLNTNIAIPPAQWTHHGLFGGNYFLKPESGAPTLASRAGEPATRYIASRSLRPAILANACRARGQRPREPEPGKSPIEAGAANHDGPTSSLWDDYASPAGKSP